MGLLRRPTAAAVVVTTALVGGLLGYGWWRHRYPYGWSHCCDKGLMLALNGFAETHGGAFPHGRATPEASLGLLYPDFADPNLLRGKTVPQEVVQRLLQNGGVLGPDSCGWHYVEGLRVTDDPKLALCWDKAGLGHNGERLPAGGHYVIFVGLSIEYIPGERWADFVAEQHRLRAALGPGRAVRESVDEGH
jgi:hypothetical protein